MERGVFAVARDAPHTTLDPQPWTLNLQQLQRPREHGVVGHFVHARDHAATVSVGTVAHGIGRVRKARASAHRERRRDGAGRCRRRRRAPKRGSRARAPRSRGAALANVWAEARGGGRRAVRRRAPTRRSGRSRARGSGRARGGRSAPLPTPSRRGRRPGARATKGRGTDARNASASGAGIAVRYAASGARVRTSTAVGSRRARFCSTTCGVLGRGHDRDRAEDGGRGLAARGARETDHGRARRPGDERRLPEPLDVDRESGERTPGSPGAGGRRPGACRGAGAAASTLACRPRRRDRRWDCPRAAPRTCAPRPSRPWLRSRARSPPSAARGSRRPWKRAERSGGAHPHARRLTTAASGRPRPRPRAPRA